MRRSLSLAVCFMLLAAATAGAAPSITLGTYDLMPNLADQVIPIFVSGTESIDGVNLYLQIDNGIAGPKISAVDMVVGTIFESNHFGEATVGLGSTHTLPDRNVYASVLTNTGTVVANGKLATVKVDTTGLMDGQWAFRLTAQNPVGQFNSSFLVQGAEIPVAGHDGAIRVVPEPATLALLCMALAVAPVAMIRRRLRK